MTRKRIRVLNRVVGKNQLGEIRLLRVQYNDGSKSWNVSNGGCLALLGNDREYVSRYVRSLRKGAYHAEV